MSHKWHDYTEGVIVPEKLNTYVLNPSPDTSKKKFLEVQRRQPSV